MKKRATALFLIFSCLAGKGLHAHETPADSLERSAYNIDESVITGTRNITDVRHLSQTVSVVDRTTIERNMQPSVLPVLTQQVPGLFVTSRGLMGYGVSDGHAGTISLRGLSGDAASA